MGLVQSGFSQNKVGCQSGFFTEQQWIIYKDRRRDIFYKDKVRIKTHTLVYSFEGKEIGMRKVVRVYEKNQRQSNNLKG